MLSELMQQRDNTTATVLTNADTCSLNVISGVLQGGGFCVGGCSDGNYLMQCGDVIPYLPVGGVTFR